MDAVRLAPALLGVVVLLGGCDAGPSSGDEATATPRSLAALVVQYLPQHPTAAYDAEVPGKLSAKVEFGPADAPDSVLVTVEGIAEGGADTRRQICVLCDITELPDGSTMHVTRGDRVPGGKFGETGYVRVSIFRETEVVELTYEGRPIRVHGAATRAGALDVETLIEIAQDPSLGRTTVQGLVDRGEKLRSWRS